MVTHTPHFPRFVMADRLVPDLERLKKIFFGPSKSGQKANPLVATKHPKNTLVPLFSTFLFLSQKFFQNWSQSIRHDESRKMRGMSDQLFRKTLSEDPFLSFVFFFHFFGIGMDKTSKRFFACFSNFLYALKRWLTRTSENVLQKYFLDVLAQPPSSLIVWFFSLWVWTKHPKNTFAACFMGFGLEWPAREYTIRQIWRKAF